MTAQHILDRYIPLRGIQIGVYWETTESVLLEFKDDISIFKSISVDGDAVFSTTGPISEVKKVYPPNTSPLFDFPDPVILVLDSDPSRLTSTMIQVYIKTNY